VYGRIKYKHVSHIVWSHSHVYVITIMCVLVTNVDVVVFFVSNKHLLN